MEHILLKITEEEEKHADPLDKINVRAEGTPINDQKEKHDENKTDVPEILIRKMDMCVNNNIIRNGEVLNYNPHALSRCVTGGSVLLGGYSIFFYKIPTNWQTDVNRLVRLNGGKTTKKIMSADFIVYYINRYRCSDCNIRQIPLASFYNYIVGPTTAEVSFA